MMPVKCMNPISHYSKIAVNHKLKRSNTTNYNYNLSSNELFKDIESIQNAFKTISKADPFKGMLLDFSLLPSKEMFKESRVFKNILRARIEVEREAGIHVLGLKVSSSDGDIMKAAIECGFRHHHANAEYSLMNLCLQGHSISECSFPAYKTVSAGVTAVVFDAELKKVLVVTEKTGITKSKPPTGGIDYGVNQDTPLKAVIRELKEEVNIEVNASDAVLVGTGWSNNYRQNNPDISYIFAFRLKEMQETVIQQSEIKKAEWVSIQDFALLPEEEKEKPWLLRNAVFVAHQALKNQKDLWKPQTLYLTTGKPVEFHSVPCPEKVFKEIDGQWHQAIGLE